jgi:4'-phosphopantetheinyl transferase EntD
VYPPDRRPSSVRGLADRDAESSLQELAGDEIHLAVATRPRTTEDFRDHEFRLGRAALARVLTRRGDRCDPLQVRFPHPALSISHSADTAVAVGLRSRAAATGLGVDLELPRAIDRRAARYFLSEGERLPTEDPAALQQLWTIKEAVFKADLHNAGLLLRDYFICELRGGDVVTEGVARRGATFFRFRSFRLPEMLLSIALPERTSA